jgi:hypothetical protein
MRPSCLESGTGRDEALERLHEMFFGLRNGPFGLRDPADHLMGPADPQRKTGFRRDIQRSAGDLSSLIQLTAQEIGLTQHCPKPCRVLPGANLVSELDGLLQHGTACEITFRVGLVRIARINAL